MSLLAYDGDCAFCTRVAGLLPLLRLECAVVHLSSLDLPALGIDPRRAQQEMPFVDSDGRVTYGHRALAAALHTGPLPCRLAAAALVAPPIDPIAERVYAWVAANRGRLPGGTPACALPTP